MKPGAHLKGHGTKQVVIETISAETGLVPLTTTLMTRLLSLMGVSENRGP